MNLRPMIFATLMLASCATTPPHTAAAQLRVATFNLALNDNAAGGVIARLEREDAAARKLAAIIQTVRPDVILLNELDFDLQSRALDLFQQRYLEQGAQAIRYPYRYLASVNTGEASGLDLNGDGKTDTPEDAWGYGAHPGQYGMAVLSMFPIDTARVRSFQRFRWADMPKAQRPQNPDGSWYHPDAIWQQLRLSSKSHWDVPIQTPKGEFHLLASHPTPPVFDGPEDRNGRRNFDEIRLFADYVDPQRSGYLIDDNGVRGGIAAGAAFVIVGDNNADPIEGVSFQTAINQFLKHPMIQPITPRQLGDANKKATADFGAVGQMRVDYVLPSHNFSVINSGVFWPAEDDPRHAWIDASDHRLVWADLSF